MMDYAHFWNQVKVFTWASMKARYRKTWAGVLWVVASPILTYSIQALVFKHFLKLEVPDYYLFLLGGLLPWIFLVSTIEMCTPLYVTHAEVLKSFQLSPVVLLASQILDNFINFLIAFLFLLVPLVISQSSFHLGLFFLPLALAQLLITVAAIASVFSLLQVFYRDIRYIIPFFVNILFFLTPIFYPKEIVPDRFRFLIEFNPILKIITPFRMSIYEFELYPFILAMGEGLIVTVVIVICSLFFWRRSVNEFYLHL
jgi:lipopolysaccharide transport system permease protein